MKECTSFGMFEFHFRVIYRCLHQVFFSLVPRIERNTENVICSVERWITSIYCLFKINKN